MKGLKRTSRWVLAILFIAALAQSIFDYTVASVSSSSPSLETGAEGDLYAATDSQPAIGVTRLAADPTEYLYGTAQSASFTISDPDNSIDLAFNDLTASASGKWGADIINNWTFTAIQDTTLTPTTVTAEYRFYQSGWKNDPFAVEVYDGSSWSTLDTFSESNPPPTVLTTKSYDASAVLDTKAKIDAAQMRFRATGKEGGADEFTIYVDEVRLIVSGVAAPGVVKQAHYRIGNDKPLSAMTWKGGVDQRAINIRRNTNFRIRFQVYNDGGQTTSWQPQLEWSITSGSGYAAVPTSSGSAPFFVTDTTQFSNGDSILTADFGCGSGTGTAQDGVAYDTENPPATAISLPGGYYTEVEFNLRANDNAAYDTYYYFRLTDSGTALDAYDVTEAVIRIQPQPSASDPHNTYTSLTAKCAACHRVHTGLGKSLRKESAEEQVCFSCHDGTGATTNISAQFAKAYKHPVSSQSGVHQVGESTASAFSGSNRHVECEDCHKPHSRWPGAHDLGNNAVSLIIGEASGLSVSNGAAWTTPTFTFESSVSYEYELCFKCHTSWSGVTTRTYPSYSTEGFTLTDQSVEFNPANRAYHPVEEKGKNQSTNPNYLATFVSPITPSSTIYCSDCHGSETPSEPAGPHGSANKSLKAGSTYDAATDTGIVCYKCHRYDVYGLPGEDLAPNSSLSRFPHPLKSRHSDNSLNIWGIFCLNCHGGRNPGPDGILGNADDVPGGIHGTNAGPGAEAGTEPLGDHFMNGAAMLSFEEGQGGVSNSAKCWTQDTEDAINLCDQGHSGTAFTPAYDY
jgi:predicted CXXCH cytochrome family protein